MTTYTSKNDSATTEITPAYFLSGKKVLIVDESTAATASAAFLLEQNGMQVTTANNGAAAVSILKKNRFDIILMEIEMQEMNGFDTMAAIQKSGITTPVLASTSFKHPEVMDILKKCGFRDTVVKPFDAEDLLIPMVFYVEKN